MRAYKSAVFALVAFTVGALLLRAPNAEPAEMTPYVALGSPAPFLVGAAGVGLGSSQTSNWRDLARKGVPFFEWPIDAKLAAVQDHTTAVLRATPTEEDWELFKLQHSYIAEFRQFIAKITATNLTPEDPEPPNTVRATPAGPFQHEAPINGRTRWRAVVALPDGVTPSGGDVIFELFGNLGQVDLKRVPLKGGAATYTTVRLPAQRYMLRARYEPLNTGNAPSAGLVYLTVQ